MVFVILIKMNLYFTMASPSGRRRNYDNGVSEGCVEGKGKRKRRMGRRKRTAKAVSGKGEEDRRRRRRRGGVRGGRRGIGKRRG